MRHALPQKAGYRFDGLCHSNDSPLYSDGYGGAMLAWEYPVQCAVAWIATVTLIVILARFGYWIVWYWIDRLSSEKWRREEKSKWDLPPVA